MALHQSTGLRTLLLAGHTLESLFQDAVVHCYSGAQPIDADRAVSGTLLGSITRNGGAFTPGSPTNGLRLIRSGLYVLKDPNHLWRFSGVATGTLGWFRVCANAVDDGLASAVSVRMDGAIGLADDEGDVQMRFNALDVSPSTVIDIPAFIYTLPPLPTV